MAKTIDIVVPDLGDFDDVEVIEVLVEAGASVEREEGLITLETDKASMDIPSPENGTIESLTVSVGDKVATGDVIGQLTVQVSDTVVITPAIAAPPDGDTTVLTESELETPASRGKQTLVVPDLGDFADVEIIEIHIEAGSTVDIEDPLVTLETDKAAMDVPAVVAGTIEEVLVKVGDTVSEGSSLAIIDAIAAPANAPPAQEAAPAEEAEKPAAVPAAPAKPAAPVQPVTPASLPAIDEAGFSKAHASPSVRKLARELGVNLVQVTGSGPKQRILHDDVKAFVKAILSGQVAAPAGAALPETPKSIIRSLARSNWKSSRVSRRSPDHAFRRAGSTCRMSRNTILLTFRISRPNARS